MKDSETSLSDVVGVLSNLDNSEQRALIRQSAADQISPVWVVPRHVPAIECPFHHLDDVAISVALHRRCVADSFGKDLPRIVRIGRCHLQSVLDTP
jgi:hypothetical protein